MQSISSTGACLRLTARSFQITQVRNHVKMYPWRFIKSYRESYLDTTKTPYTDKNNPNEFNTWAKKRKPWMEVIPKDKDNRWNAYKMNDQYKSDPVEARQTAESKLTRFQNSLRDRGAAREARSYEPPGDVEERILAIYKQLELPDKSNLNTPESRGVKCSLIATCTNMFNHDLPSSYLNEMGTVDDVIEYFKTPVRGTNPYTSMIKKQNDLPVNLHLVAEPQRFDRETDTRFGGHSALPGIVSAVPGLRAKKKYATLNQDEFQWPDV